MKKALLIFLLPTLISNWAYSQFSVSLEVAPSLPLSGVAIPGFTNVSADGNEEVIIATLGAGLSISGGMQYDLSETFFVGLEASYFKSFEGSLEKYDVSGPGSLTTITFNANALYLTPSLGLNINENFYTKVGMVFALNQTVNVDVDLEGTPLTGTSKSVYEGTQNKLDVGLQTTLGYQKKINEKLSWFAELQFLNMVYKPDRYSNTQNFDGLPLDPTVQFRKEVPYGVEDDNLELTFPIPFSSIGVGVGLKMKL